MPRNDDDRMLTPQNRGRRASGNAAMDAVGPITTGRGNAIKERLEEKEKRNYAPPKPARDKLPSVASRGNGKKSRTA